MNVTATDATLGAVITDVDLTSVTDDLWEVIHATFLEYGVLIFPDQHLTEDEQGALALRFGNPEKMHPQQPGPSVQLSNQKPNGELTNPEDEGYRLLRGNEGWHTDSTYMPLAAKAGMLAALVVPPKNGETEFADMRAAWDELDQETQKNLEGLSAYHSLYYSQSRSGYIHTTDHMYGFHDKGAPLRPIVKTHPETGRKSIYTGRHAYGIPGMSSQESETLLSDLLESACQPPRTHKHSWSVGDIVVWDNRCVMHRARPYDKNHARTLRASRISGEPESELAPTFADHRASDFRPSSSNESSLAS
ncbi:MAG: TauD/TfdA family dioxygenase [Pseudomonadota bacterium]|nr:TauD/TfdA family dioxygenase [Pseudomonadota bacterium]